MQHPRARGQVVAAGGDEGVGSTGVVLRIEVTPVEDDGVTLLADVQILGESGVSRASQRGVGLGENHAVDSPDGEGVADDEVHGTAAVAAGPHDELGLGLLRTEHQPVREYARDVLLDGLADRQHLAPGRGHLDAGLLEHVHVVEEGAVAGQVRHGVLDAVVLGVVAEALDQIRQGGLIVAALLLLLVLEGLELLLAVVDPGVGGDRRRIAVEVGGGDGTTRR